MSERESRAVGAGVTIKVRDCEYMLRPITVQQLCDLEREALQFYRRQVLETYRANADLLGERADELMVQKLEEVSRLSLDDLPKKKAHDASKVPITKGMRRWIEAFRDESGGEPGELSDAQLRALLVTALDQERIAPKQVEKMAGRRPVLAKVRYDQWWVTGCFEGMVSFIHSSIRVNHPDISKDEIRSWPVSAIFESAREVESVTAPSLGNG